MENIDWKSTSKELEKKLNPDNVKPPNQGAKGDYIEGWHAIAEANRIFGFGGWSSEILSLIMAGQPYENQKGNKVVNYICQMRVTVGGVTREDVGFGSGISSDLGSAHEGATKEATTDALKRTLRTFGNQFGLALYDKQKSNVGYDEPTEEECAEVWGRLIANIRKELEGVDYDDHETKGKIYERYWNGLAKYRMQTHRWDVALKKEINPVTESDE